MLLAISKQLGFLQTCCHFQVTLALDILYAFPGSDGALAQTCLQVGTFGKQRDMDWVLEEKDKVSSYFLFCVCWLLVVGCWLLVVGCWLLVVGCWLLVVGCWLLVVGCWLFVVVVVVVVVIVVSLTYLYYSDFRFLKPPKRDVCCITEHDRQQETEPTINRHLSP